MEWHAPTPSHRLQRSPRVCGRRRAAHCPPALHPHSWSTSARSTPVSPGQEGLKLLNKQKGGKGCVPGLDAQLAPVCHTDCTVRQKLAASRTVGPRLHLHLLPGCHATSTGSLPLQPGLACLHFYADPLGTAAVQMCAWRRRWRWLKAASCTPRWWAMLWTAQWPCTAMPATTRRRGQVRDCMPLHTAVGGVAGSGGALDRAAAGHSQAVQAGGSAG